MAFNEVSAAERQRIGQMVKPVTDKMAAAYDPELVKLYQSELARTSR